MRREILPLTGLRFFAALFVCTAHMAPHFLLKGSSLCDFITRLAAEGMTLFFVLSGFVIHYNYSNSIACNPKTGLYQFFVSRFARLAPLYFVCIFFDIYLTLTHNVNYSGLRLSTLLVKVAPYYLTFTHTWLYKIIGGTSLVYPFGWITPLTWSISTEWFFYFAYPLICLGLLFIPKVRGKIIFCFIISFYAIGIVAFLTINLNSINNTAIQSFGPVADFYSHGGQDSFFRWLIYFSPYSRASEFIIGCVIAALYMQVGRQLKTSKQSQAVGFILTVGSILLVVLSHYYIWNPPNGVAFSWMPYLHRSFGFAPAFAFVIFCCARYQNIITHILSSRLILIGGEISYSMYLLHLIIIEKLIHGKYQDFISRQSSVTTYLIYLSVLFAIAYLSYRIIEVPARGFIRQKLLKMKPISVMDSSLIKETQTV